MNCTCIHSTGYRATLQQRDGYCNPAKVISVATDVTPTLTILLRLTACMYGMCRVFQSSVGCARSWTCDRYATQNGWSLLRHAKEQSFTLWPVHEYINNCRSSVGHGHMIKGSGYRRLLS